MKAAPLVSCLCITRNRVNLLKRAVTCFQDQTHPHIELILIYEADDNSTTAYVKQLEDPRIIPICVSVSPKRKLGALRNIAVEHANGEFVATWDDDDWYAPDRLEQQLLALEGSDKIACLLLRWLIFDVANKKGYVSFQRPWEGSMLCRKASLPAYPEISRDEDRHAITMLQESGGIELLDMPELYIYMIHDTNTWDRAHFIFNIKNSRPLLEEDNAQIIELLSLYSASAM